MKIYTRTGDEGQTSLFAGGRVSKHHVRLHTYGTVDELNTILGLAIAAGLSERLLGQIERIQAELFVLGADLATPLDAETGREMRVRSDLVTQLEYDIDVWSDELPELEHFIVPGGSLGGAFLHQARCVCRRAERWLAALQEEAPVNAEAVRYMNRLSDFLFVAARVANQAAGQGEKKWMPRAGEKK